MMEIIQIGKIYWKYKQNLQIKFRIKKKPYYWYVIRDGNLKPISDLRFAYAVRDREDEEDEPKKTPNKQ